MMHDCEYNLHNMMNENLMNVRTLYVCMREDVSAKVSQKNRVAHDIDRVAFENVK